MGNYNLKANYSIVIPSNNNEKYSPSAPSTRATSMMDNAIFIVESAALRTAQRRHLELSHSGFYWSDTLNFTPKQYTLVWDACSAVKSSLDLLEVIHGAKKNIHQGSILEEIQDRYTTISNGIAEGVEQATPLDKDHPLLQRSYQVMQQSASLISSWKRVFSLGLHNEAALCFFTESYFRYSTAITFNQCCLSIANGTVFEEHFNPWSHDASSFLQEMLDCYTKKKELHSHLLVAKQQLEKKRAELDSSFVAIVEEAIHHTEAALKNMDHLERAQLLKQVQPLFCPISLRSGINPLYLSKKVPFDSTAYEKKRIEAIGQKGVSIGILEQLKKIPVIL